MDEDALLERWFSGWLYIRTCYGLCWNVTLSALCSHTCEIKVVSHHANTEHLGCKWSFRRYPELLLDRADRRMHSIFNLTLHHVCILRNLCDIMRCGGHSLCKQAESNYFPACYSCHSLIQVWNWWATSCEKRRHCSLEEMAVTRLTERNSIWRS